jgi:polysaccharide export outer membrane protein
MRAGRHLFLLTLALAVSGCQHASAPPHAVVVQPYPQSLDRIAYERHVARAPAMAAPVARPMPAHVMHAPVAMPAPVAAPVAVPIEAATPPAPPYTLDSGDKLRVTVFGQEGLTNSYFVDAAGNVTLPLIGPVPARGLTTQQLARAVAQKLRGGFIREPHVAIEVEIYRPFFILGEVTQPGQYPYVPNMTVETAVAIAGGFTPRAYRYDVKLDRPEGGTMRSRTNIPLLTRIKPGDTVIIKERWF